MTVTERGKMLSKTNRVSEKKKRVENSASSGFLLNKFKIYSELPGQIRIGVNWMLAGFRVEQTMPVFQMKGS